MKKAISPVVVLILVLTVIIGCAERTPKRDQIPILKARLLSLQTAVGEMNRPAIDSLLSPQILSKDQNSDSLLSFVYGPQQDYPFVQFGKYDIVYTKDKARIDCYVMDSTGTTARPITLYLALQHDMWLFTGFAEGAAEATDSLP